jgi:uncharacterized protein YceK
VRRIALVVLLASAGCGSVLNLARPGRPEPMGGVANDVDFLRHATWPDSVFLLPLMAVELPLSFSLDLLTFPVTIPALLERTSSDPPEPPASAFPFAHVPLEVSAVESTSDGGERVVFKHESGGITSRFRLTVRPGSDERDRFVIERLPGEDYSALRAHVLTFQGYLQVEAGDPVDRIAGTAYRAPNMDPGRVFSSPLPTSRWKRIGLEPDEDRDATFYLLWNEADGRAAIFGGGLPAAPRRLAGLFH